MKQNTHSATRSVTLKASTNSSLSLVFKNLAADGVGVHSQILQTILLHYLPLALPKEHPSAKAKALESIHKLQAQAKIIADYFGIDLHTQKFTPSTNPIDRENLNTITHRDRFIDLEIDRSIDLPLDQPRVEPASTRAELISESEQTSEISYVRPDLINSLGWEG